MAAQKLSKATKKELQAPDEFQESMAKVLEFFDVGNPDDFLRRWLP